MSIWQFLLQQDNAQLSEKDKYQVMTMLNRFPSNEMNEWAAQVYAPFIFVEFELERLRSQLYVPLTDEMIHELVEQAVRAMQQQNVIPVFTPDNVRENDWRNFDQNQNNFLEMSEIDEFVKILRKSPNRFIFTSEVINFHFLADHPLLRDRILSVYSALAKDTKYEQ